MTSQPQLDARPFAAAGARAGLLAAGPLASGIGPAMLDRLVQLVTLDPGEHERIPVRAPYTGELLGEIPRATPADVAEGVRRARAAQPAWAAGGVRERARVALRFHDLLLDRRDQALDLIQLESGKARAHALEEVLDTAIVARHYATHAGRYLRPRRHRGALPLLTDTRELHHPLGVVGVIAPWNFPLLLSITDLVAALMAGNSAVLCPDVQSSFTALWAAELLHEAGLPRDVLAVVTGGGRELGPQLVEGVDFVMFTGSTRTGRVVARLAAERLIGVSLELGGKNPMLVLADAELERAVDGAARGAFVGAGQVCLSIERVYVHESLYDDFAARLAERARSLRLGAALDYSAEIGSMTTERQLAATEAHVRDALDKGATLLAGGRRRPDVGPLFFEPTVLAGVRPGMTLHDEETFGPVVALYPVASDDEAVQRANASRYGLNASVWSRRARHAARVARRLRTGTVNVNEAYAAAWMSTHAPVGGMKESGLGRRHGAEGILKYTETQTIAAQRGLPLAPPSFMAPQRYAEVMTRLVRLMSRVPGLR